MKCFICNTAHLTAYEDVMDMEPDDVIGVCAACVADAALGAAVRRMPPDHKLFNGNELGWFVDNGNDRFAGEGDTPEAAMIAAGLMKGEER